MNKLLTILLFLTVFSVFSQEQRPIKKDLKVGLVLSGGGAKGFAHIGILKKLEQAGVRVDYIGGTSMGAIIGAMYASGYSAVEIDSLIRKLDFYKIMQDNIPRKSKPFYEKKSGEKYALTFPVTNGTVGLPKAISKGQNILNLTSELLRHVDTITDFKKLPIPFFCIATDIENGDEVILDKGFLPKAVQASGAFPTLLEPVEINGRLLIDGGVVNNFPVELVKKMGADIIIGVDLRENYDDREGLDSAVKIINQIISFQMYEHYDDKIKQTNVYIRPNIKGYQVTSFDKLDEIVKIGEDSGIEYYERFLEIAKQQTVKRKPFKRKEIAKEFTIKAIDIQGNRDYTRTYVKGKMKINNGDKISYADLSEGINNLSATGNFSSIQYEVEDVFNSDESIIRLKLKQNDITTYVKLSPHYDNLYKTGVLANVTSKHVFTKNDVFSADLILGDNLRYNLDYFIDNGSYWSFGLKSRYNNFNSDVHIDGLNINEVNLNYIDFTNQLYFQTVFNRKFALGVGAEYKRINAYTKTLITNANDGKTYFDKTDYYNAISYIQFDTYDKKYFQKEGALIDIDFRWYLFSSDYNNNFNTFSQLRGKLGYAHTFFDKLTTHFTSEAGITIGVNNNFVLDYHLGGYGENYINTFIPFYGYKFAELTSSSFLKSTIKLRYEVLTNHYLMSNLSVARNDANLFNNGQIFENTKFGYGVGYGFDSFLGPIELNYTHSPDTKNSFWYFNLGYWF